MVKESLWYVEVWDGKAFQDQCGPMTESYAKDHYQQQVTIMPNCPARLVEKVFHEAHGGRQ